MIAKTYLALRCACKGDPTNDKTRIFKYVSGLVRHRG